MTERFFAPCPRGLEATARRRARGASARATSRPPTAASRSRASSTSPTARISSRASRAASCGASAAAPIADERDLYALVHAIDWTRHFTAERTLRVDVTATRSPLTSLEFATLRVKDAVCDRFRERSRRASVGRQARARRARSRAPHRTRGDDLPRHVRRAAVQARLPSRRRRGAAARKPRRRIAGAWPTGHPSGRCSIRCAAAARSSPRRR